MAKKKKKSKFKKILKTLGKVAALGGAAYGASKLFGGRRKGNVLKTAASEDANIGYSPFRGGLVDANDMNYTPKKVIPDYGDPQEGLFVGGKKGGRVTKRGIGIAKRGFGRALKGKK